MAEPNKVPSVSPAERRAAHIDPAKAGARHAERLVAQFTKRAGLGDGAADALGAIAGQFAEGLAQHFAGIFAEKGGVPTAELSKAYKQLGKLHDIDAFIANPPADVTHDNGLVDSRTFAIKPSEQRGLYRAEGSIAKPGHAVGKVFDKLELDLKGFDGNVAEILDFAGAAKKNLGDKKSWMTIVGQMAMAALGQPGDPKARLAAAMNAGVEGVKSAASKPVDGLDVIDTTAKVVGSRTGTKTGLENSAPKTSNTGSQSGALAVRAQLLSGLKNQDDQVERTAGKVLGDVFRHLDVDPDKATKRKLHATLRGLMHDKSSATGKTDVVHLLDRVIGKLAEDNPDNATLKELNGFIKKATADNPDFVADKGLQEAFGQLAADGISEIVAIELGMKKPEDAKLNASLLHSLEDLLPEAPETTVDGKPVDGPGADSEPIDMSAWQADRPDIPQPFKDEALNVLKDLGLPLDDPKTAGMMNAVAEVMTRSVDQDSGAISPADFAVGLQAWLVDHGGANRKVFEGMYNQLAGALSAHAKTAQVFQQKKARFDKLQSRQADLTDRKNTASLEGELETLQNELTMLNNNLLSGEKFLGEQIAMLQRDGLNRMRMMFFEGKAPGDGIAGGDAEAIAAATAGGGGVPPGGVPPGGVPPGGGPPNGPGGPGDGRMFDRDGPTGMGILPGFNTGMRPEDEYNSKNLTIQQQRAIQCGEVLADPTLCIEDKIFLFMMWFTAFTDQEREKKLEELVQMDRETARNVKLKDEKQSELKSLQEARGRDENRLVQAQAKVERLEQAGVGGEELQAAQGELQECQTHLAERDAKIRGVEHELSDLNVKNEKAPKSREVLFMEIERLNQLRDKIMNMARSMMENSNRAIEKIFR